MGEQPQDWLWALVRLLTALDQAEQAHAVLRAAYAELQRQGRAIGDVEVRRNFFERVAQNREIVNAYLQLENIPRAISLPLARKDAPLGRTLTRMNLSMCSGL